MVFELFCTPQTRSVTKKDLKNARPIEINMGQKIIRGYVWNNGIIKTALILHGFGSAAYKFEHYVHPLVQKGYRVLAFDAPAHGLSDGKQTNALEYSEVIVQIIQQLGTVHSFIAHSFGGISLSLALEKLPHTPQTKIVFIAPATETSTALEKAIDMLKLNNTDIKKELDHLIFDLSGRQTEWFSIRRAVKNIQAQILWIHDEDDDVTPVVDALKVKSDNHSNINFVITKGLGHQRIYKENGVKKMVTDFL